MITSQQMRAARALLGIDQKRLAELANVSLPTIQRMEASDGQVRGVVETLVKVSASTPPFSQKSGMLSATFSPTAIR